MLPNPTQKSVMQHKFSNIPHAEIPRSNFKRSHGLKTAFDAGLLIPIYCDEVLPGDTFNVRLSSLARLATPIYPYMDNLHMDFFFFFVPNRLLWNNWQAFMGEHDEAGIQDTDYTVPTISSIVGGHATGTLSDYFGLPIMKHPVVANALHYRAYNLIYNEWFRDENLQDSVVVDKDDGPDDIADYVLLRRGKRHDYFTSCLPWPQKGVAVDLPLGVNAPIITGADRTFVSTEEEMRMWDRTDGTYFANNRSLNLSGPGGEVGIATAAAAYEEQVVPSNLYADLSNATAATINSLREAFQLQRLLERDARGGTRYTEIIKSHFRVDSPDSRLQRPEYLGGGSSLVSVTPIPQTGGTIGPAIQGNLAAVGYHNQNGVGFTKSFVEHGVILALVNVRADLTYQQGLNKMWSRQTKHDFYWPALAHLGEQEVLNKEIWLNADGNDDLIFGYQERYAEYRYYPSQITGILRSDATTPLDAWHLSEDFATLPVLNPSFIVSDPPVDRIIAVDTEPHFIFDGYFDITCTRPMPIYSVPGLIDHF